MEVLNQFIETHIEDGIKFLERLSTFNIQDTKEENYEAIVVPANVYENSLVYIAKHMKMTSAKLDKAFDQMLKAEVRDNRVLKNNHNIGHKKESK
jgi:hypothetical protein